MVDIAPHLLPYRWNLVVLLKDLNRPKEALEVIAPLLPTYRSENHPAAWFALNMALDLDHVVGHYQDELRWADVALEMFPDIGNFYLAKARALVGLGRITEALKVVDQGTRIKLRAGSFDSPTVMIIAGLELRVHGHRGEADDLLSRTITWYERQAASVAPEERDPDEVFNHSSALRALGRWSEAKELLLELEQREFSEVWTNGALGVVAAEMGDIDEAQRRFDAIGPKAKGYGRVWRAAIAARLGNKDRAVELLREYFSQGARYNFEFHYDVDLEPLWDYPPYQELIAPKG